jgi:hypothetical protein
MVTTESEIRHCPTHRSGVGALGSQPDARVRPRARGERASGTFSASRSSSRAKTTAQRGPFQRGVDQYSFAIHCENLPSLRFAFNFRQQRANLDRATSDAPQG